jgi:hypothetical protein
MTQEERTALIEQIIEAARKPMPEIVEKRELLGTDGKWYVGDLPIGVDVARDVDPHVRVVGFVFRSREGTTYGTREPTREALEARFNAAQEREMIVFRSDLEDRVDEKLQECADYWLGDRK